ncbi:MAG: hypothetical protein IIA87_02905 [Nanoarchaeota archaeon]|nr:hypothetical protein [Nanoarchaeota archaeon]
MTNVKLFTVEDGDWEQREMWFSRLESKVGIFLTDVVGREIVSVSAPSINISYTPEGKCKVSYGVSVVYQDKPGSVRVGPDRD